LLILKLFKIIQKLLKLQSLLTYTLQIKLRYRKILSSKNIVTFLLSFLFVLFFPLQAYKPAINRRYFVGPNWVPTGLHYAVLCTRFKSSMQTNFPWSRQPC